MEKGRAHLKMTDDQRMHLQLYLDFTCHNPLPRWIHTSRKSSRIRNSSSSSSLFLVSLIHIRVHPMINGNEHWVCCWESLCVCMCERVSTIQLVYVGQLYMEMN